MKILTKVYDFIFPVGGGTIGAITQLKDVAAQTHWDIMWDAAIVAFVGAIVGLLVKKLFDFLWAKIKKNGKNK